jgi:hypothetical protein
VHTALIQSLPVAVLFPAALGPKTPALPLDPQFASVQLPLVAKVRTLSFAFM